MPSWPRSCTLPAVTTTATSSGNRGSVRHGQDGLDDGAAVGGLHRVLDAVEGEVLHELVEGEAALGVQVHERGDQGLAVAAAAEGPADGLAPQRGQVVGAELRTGPGAAPAQGGAQPAAPGD